MRSSGSSLLCIPKARSKTHALSLLSKLGLEKYHPNKLTPQHFIEINKNSLQNQTASSLEEIPWCFLRNLYKVNAECRNSMQLPTCEEENVDYFDLYTDNGCADKQVNPLDVIVALCLCADNFLQQEMALKMSMCQLSVPLLLPSSNNSQSTLMLWALRDIIKEWCPQNLSESKGFVENNIVQADIPFYSFVRLKNCSLSKSQLLNQIFSHGQQSHNIFLHRDMDGGSIKRVIANGLVEVCWYLPCGNENLDVFLEPVAFANLRGDICESPAEFQFLFQVSNATFIFLDKVEQDEHEALMSQKDVQDKLFLVVNRKDGSKSEDMTFVKTTAEELKLPKTSVTVKNANMNLAQLSQSLCSTIKTSLSGIKSTVNIVNMVDIAVELGFYVDENKTGEQKKAAEEVIWDIGDGNVNYKRQQLPLQGENWKRLSELQKEECRLNVSDESSVEEYKGQLQDKQRAIREEQRKHKMSKAMKTFIENVSTEDKVKRDEFLKWMKLKLDTDSREKLSELHQKYKEGCEKKDPKLIAELDQALLDSSLGIEHYMREMGLIYEFSIQSQETTYDISGLPGLAAEILLDGYPLELLDGDASNIPEKWITDVLMEVHRKVGEQSRLLVLTVLGVQSTGKSTLLNIMFGVQFPVSSGRCTRGAYMLFLKVGQDLKSELDCDFIVLIDTEGLKSPDLAQLEDSYEHDNQLATFVIGLSDVAIINIAMENAAEMKDVLQITAHALLRMKQIGKKTICHFVHQNVGGVSAHSKCMTERQHILDQLNEMTVIAAEMEKQPNIKAFTDVLDYNIEKNNWNIPGLWHGTPPMAAVSTGYSEAVADFKRNLLEKVNEDRKAQPSTIPEFLEWMTSLWKSVKYENFIFSFRNTLVAHAYDNLCKQFNEWEWEFRKEILSWQKEAEVEILNTDNQSQEDFFESKKTEVSIKIEKQQTLMQQKLSDYYKTKDRHINLIEKYKADFLNSISRLALGIKDSVDTALDRALQLKASRKKFQNIQRKYRSVIEEQVMKLLSDCKDRSLTEEELKQEFEKMWDKTTADVSGLKERDVAASVLNQLRKNFTNLNVSEILHNINLKEMGNNPFKTRREHTDSWTTKLKHFFTGDLQSVADNIIESCTQFIIDKVSTNQDYHESFTNYLLEKLDGFLQQSHKDQKTNTKFETDLKLHICGIAAREFQKMHRKFLSENDPKTQLDEHKNQYLTDFLDLYINKDQGQRKAKDFVRVCIKPAVNDFINRSLCTDIVDEILTSSRSAEYSSRTYFQYHIQKELLEKDSFDSFVKYICSYEIYVKDWILKQIQQKLSDNNTLGKVKTKILLVIVKRISDATEQASKEDNDVLLPDNTESVTKFISNMQKILIKDISISEEDEKTTLFTIQSTCHTFINSFKEALDELKEELEGKFSQNQNIQETLSKLSIKPQDQLFQRVFGCGQQCPFCKVPCEAGGKQHKEHHAAVHRPQGLGRYRSTKTEKLVVALCTTTVHSNRKFKNTVTQQKRHPFKDYRTFYPEWHIPPDSSIQASDYWKYVLAQYNERFAEEYKSKPADVPEAWKKITKEQALKGLKEAFNMKTD
ncbi:up-regulator of cell proliferation-like [Salarias fasciatus]|uniref:up-regulator of cell proliferation-like n=1 Tax=Salarias fasciatus TaxID=181472 RepID=UPI001176A3CA|nr:up-regulator of cell proliferation-like [Salarias fasciatus]